MDGSRLDAFAKQLTMASRRQVLRHLVVTTLPVPLALTVRSQSAAASARGQCRAQGGVVAKTGKCHCAPGCGTGPFGCGRDPDCTCLRTSSGRGFCAQGKIFGFTGCARASDCPSGQQCGVFACPNAGGACATATDCALTGTTCLRGVCAFTTCAAPCGA